MDNTVSHVCREDHEVRNQTRRSFLWTSYFQWPSLKLRIMSIICDRERDFETTDGDIQYVKFRPIKQLESNFTPLHFLVAVTEIAFKNAIFAADPSY